jgi:sugar/nucleoside kinase (ribokinase family)
MVSVSEDGEQEKNVDAEVTFHVVGDAYVDFFSFLDGEWPESGGDSRLDQPVKCYAGGSSVNTATHLKALIKNFTEGPKPKVILHTVLNPDDHYGQMLLDHADEHDIPIDNCRRDDDDLSTGHCIAIVSGGERSFMTHQGVVGNFGADDLDVDKIAKTSTHLHLHSKFTSSYFI